MLLSHFLDFHATLAAGDDRRTLRFAVHKDRKVVFLLDIDRLCDEHLADQLAILTCLVGYEDLTEHLLRRFLSLLRAVNEVDTALKTILEGAFAPPASVYLGFDNKLSCPKGFGGS